MLQTLISPKPSQQTAEVGFNVESSEPPPRPPKHCTPWFPWERSWLPPPPAHAVTRFPEGSGLDSGIFLPQFTSLRELMFARSASYTRGSRQTSASPPTGSAQHP